jgi:hypothetical protein
MDHRSYYDITPNASKSQPKTGSDLGVGWGLKVVSVLGLEPRTSCLKGRCSTY